MLQGTRVLIYALSSRNSPKNSPDTGESVHFSHKEINWGFLVSRPAYLILERVTDWTLNDETGGSVSPCAIQEIAEDEAIDESIEKYEEYYIRQHGRKRPAPIRSDGLY